MSDQPDDPDDLYWHPTRHYEAAMEALTGDDLSGNPRLTAIAHGLLMIGRLLELELGAR